MPTTIEALVIFSVFAIPAYVAIRLYKLRNPVHYYREKQSSIEQAALYVFLGVLVNILTTLFLSSLAILTWLVFSTRFATNVSINPLVEYVAIIVLFIAVYLGTGFVFSLLIGEFFASVMPPDLPLWVEEVTRIKVTETDREITWLLVHLKNGDRCLGLVSEHKWVGDKDNSVELIMEKAWYQPADSDEKEKEKAGRILLRSDDILWLSPHSTEALN
jgi:hypothetical protein